jgi:hypothetical protein
MQEPYAVVPHVRICAGGAAGNCRPYRDRYYSSVNPRKSNASGLPIVHGETSAKYELGERLKALYKQTQRNLELLIPSGANE